MTTPTATGPRTGMLAPRSRIVLAGTTLTSDVSRCVLAVRYDNNIDLADMVTIELDNSGHRFTDSALFALGTTLEVYLGYGADLQPMMLGEISAIEPSFPSSGAPTITVTAYDRSQRMRHDVPDRPAFRFMTDSAIAAQIAAEAGLVPVVDPSLFGPHDKLQQTSSDMALLKERARANHFDVYVRWDRLYFRFPRPQTEAVVLEWGTTLAEFTPRLSTAAQSGVAVVRGYDEQLAQTIVGFAGAVDLDLDTVVERLGSTARDILTGLGRRVLRGQPVKSPFDAATLAKSMLQEILDGMYEATGSCPGHPALQAGEAVVVRGLGDRFSGTYRLTRVTHVLDDGGYRTQFESTQRSSSSVLTLLRRQVVEQPAPDRREPVTGVVLGTVDSVDPARGVAQVRLPWFTDTDDTVTATCVTPMAGPGLGLALLPAPDDQVLLAFEHGDIEHPFVLGGVWDAVKGTPVPESGQDNAVRRLRTAAGHTVTLDDTEGAEQITVTDAAGSSIELLPDGTVRITAHKDLELLAPEGDVRINARNVAVTVEAVTGTMDVGRQE